MWAWQQVTSPLINTFTCRLEKKALPSCPHVWLSQRLQEAFSEAPLAEEHPLQQGKTSEKQGSSEAWYTRVSLEPCAEGISLNVHSLKKHSAALRRPSAKKTMKRLYLCHEFCARESISRIACARDSVPAVNSWGREEEKEVIFPHAPLMILLARLHCNLQPRGGGRDCCSFLCWPGMDICGSCS